MNVFSKRPSGVAGLDSITHGGLPERRCTLLLGGPGSGKTVLALQTLVNAARLREEPGIFVAFEERTQEVIANASSFGWNIPELVDRKLFFLDARIPSDTFPCGNFDLSGLLNGLSAKSEQMGAKWIVFDAIDVLLSLLDNHSLEMREMYRLREWLANAGLTGLITAKLDDTDNHFRLRYNSLQFLSDCVIRLEHRLQDQVSLRELRVVKYRGSAFSENLAYYVLGPKGMEVADVRADSEQVKVSLERISSGIPRLDAMLSGGYYRGATVLLTGLPGTAKTTLASAFAEASCAAGEKVLYFAFDEPPAEIVRNLTSVSIDLQSHLQSGRLIMLGSRTDFGSSEEHFLRMATLIDEHAPNCVIVDPFSTLLRAGGNIIATSVARRMVALGKQRQITMILTALQETNQLEVESNHMHISTIADTWIHLTYHEAAGERNRAMSIIKSRGTAHSNQLRELVLSDQGVSLADVYSASGAVRMGTLRWEAEEAERRAENLAIQEREAKRREIELSLEDLQAKLAVLQHELEIRRESLSILESQSSELDIARAKNVLRRSELRGGDL